MKKILVSVLSSCLLASALSAVSFKEDSLKVSFEGYKTKDMIGNFPILIKGKNEISWTGNVSKVEILPRTAYK